MYLVTVFDQATKQYALDNTPITRDNRLDDLLFQFTTLSVHGQNELKQEVEKNGMAKVRGKGNYAVTVKKYSVEVVSQ